MLGAERATQLLLNLNRPLSFETPTEIAGSAIGRSASSNDQFYTLLETPPAGHAQGASQQ
jgi:hypothetical protein